MQLGSLIFLLAQDNYNNTWLYSLFLQVCDVFLGSSFKVFADTLESGGIIKAICVPSGAKAYSNTALKRGDLYNEAIKSGAKGLPFLKVLDDGKKMQWVIHTSVIHQMRVEQVVLNSLLIILGAVEGISALVSSLDPMKKEQLLKQLSAGSGDLILFAVGHPAAVNKTLDRLRVYVANNLGLIDPVSLQSPNNLYFMFDVLTRKERMIFHSLALTYFT